MEFQRCGRCSNLVLTGEMVTITLVEYTALLARPGLSTPLHFGKPSTSRITRDSELSAYVVELALPGTMRADEIRNACIHRFGHDRVPSKSSFSRFLLTAARSGVPGAPTRPRKGA